MNKRRITLNRWHIKHFLFCSTSQRTKQLAHKICYGILSQPALHLAEILHTTVFLKWNAITQSWSQRSLQQSFLVFCLFLSSYRNVMVKDNSNFTDASKSISLSQQPFAAVHHHSSCATEAQHETQIYLCISF